MAQYLFFFKNLFPMIFFCFFAIGCFEQSGNDAGNEAGDGGIIHGSISDEYGIVRTWKLIKIDDTPTSVDENNGRWVFEPDGTYKFYFDYLDYYIQDYGTYTFNGTTLTLNPEFDSDNVLSIVHGDNYTQHTIELSESNDTISFADDEGDRWTFQIMHNLDMDFYDEESFSDCMHRPSGCVCYSVNDGYIFLVCDDTCSERDEYFWKGKLVSVLLCTRNDYYHVNDTNLINIVNKN